MRKLFTIINEYAIKPVFWSRECLGVLDLILVKEGHELFLGGVCKLTPDIHNILLKPMWIILVVMLSSAKSLLHVQKHKI